VWTGLSGLRIGTSGVFCTQWWSSRFHKIQGISWVAETVNIWKWKLFHRVNLLLVGTAGLLYNWLDHDDDDAWRQGFWMFESVENNGKILRLVLRVAFLTFVGPCIVIHFYSKTNQMHNISHLFWNNTLHVLDIHSVHHQEEDHTHSIRYMSYRFCGLLASSHKTCMTYLMPCVRSEAPDDGRRDHPKRSVLSQMK
jgi:hypothetical protein